MIPFLPPHYTFRSLGISVGFHLFWRQSWNQCWVHLQLHLFWRVFLGFLGSSRPKTKMDIQRKCWECSSLNGYLTRFSIEEFENHNSIVHADCLHKCKICPCKFLNYRDMVDHTMRDHEKTICVECFEDKGLEYFFSRDEMSRHYSKEHEFSKKKCYICCNRFKHDSGLQDHIDYFHGQKSVPVLVTCVHCPHYSAVIEDLKRHNASVHPKKKYPYECKCGNVFKDSATRDVHKRNKCRGLNDC